MSDNSSLHGNPLSLRPLIRALRACGLRYPLVSTVTTILLVNGLVVLYLRLMGRPYGPPEGALQLWSSGLTAADNSLHLSDPYSFLHAIFGMGLFALIDRLKPRWALREKLIIAILGSAFWEVVENTPPIVALFNDMTNPQAYHGDSVVNSLSDTAFVAAGFLFASRAPWWMTLLVALIAEIVVSLWIDDGLILGTLKVFGLYS